MTLTAQDEDLVYEKIRKSPRYFIEDILGDKLDEQQIAIVEAFPTTRRMGVKSGHSCGKDWLAGRLALWFHVAHYPSIVVTTGPTDRQVKLATWGEIRAAYKKSKVPIGGELLPEACKLRSFDENNIANPHHYMVGYTSDDPDAFQGIHTDNVLIIVTEAQGVDPTMWPAIESLMTSMNAHLLLIGNALYEPESEFYAAFSSKAAMYKQFTLDSRKSSHCSEQYIADVREAHGEGSPYWLARVEGIFPSDISDTLIPLSWIEKAQARWGSASIDGAKTLGVDVARFGSDLTVFVKGEGERFSVHDWKQGQDLMETAGKVISFGRALGVQDADIRIDDTGLGGGVTDRVREQGHRVTAINFGSKSTDEETYADARSEILWLLRERFRVGNIAIDPRDGKLLGDLSILKYKMTSRGQIKAEPKPEMKKRLGRSPDRGDAIGLAAIPQTIARDLGTGGKPSQGLLDYMRERAAAQKGKVEQVAFSRPATDIPGAMQAVGGNVAHERTEPALAPVPLGQRT